MQPTDITEIDPDKSIARANAVYEQDIDEQEYADSREPGMALTDEETASLPSRLSGDAGESPIDTDFGARRTGRPVPGVYTPARFRARSKQALRLRFGQQAAQALQQRISSAVRFGTPPVAVQEAADEARSKIDAALTLVRDRANDMAPGYATDVASAKAVSDAGALAQAAVVRLEAVAAEYADEHLASLTDGLEGKREAAADALRAAYAAYKEFANTRAAAAALAEESGHWAPGGWHQHPDQRELDPTANVGALARVLKIVTADDDWLSGRFITAEYDGIPPHTIDAMSKRAEATSAGSFSRQLVARMRNLSDDDLDLQRAVAARDIRIANTASPWVGGQAPRIVQG